MAANTHEILKRARHRDLADLATGVGGGADIVSRISHTSPLPHPHQIDEICMKLTFVPGQNHSKVEPPSTLANLHPHSEPTKVAIV